ncbi:uncharacterized protein LOC121504971 [Cheilinus undulatus]|uniref:uncharacterized protein LOC121504971 n=1 Tax=Cheilinus undulatus TaxID=241271 RepID=UPI001BD41D39|nr:uncharacterized protein LOC121504971 [Cheilinus undulatus]
MFGKHMKHDTFVSSGMNACFKASAVHGSVVEQLHSAHEAEIKERWECISRSVAVTQFLAKQNVPFSGHDERASSHNQGNFLECVKLLKQFDPFLQSYSPPLHHTYLSLSSQSEITECCAEEVTAAIGVFAGNGGIERAYGGAAVMSGAVGGVQAKFSVKHPEAIYVHCYAHQLDLHIHVDFTLEGGEVLVDNNYLASKKESLAIKDMQCVFNLLDNIMFPTLTQVIQISLTIPVNRCSYERSFSVLRWLHTWLRCTMGQERLHHLVVLAVEKEELLKLGHSQVSDRFAKMKNRRHALMLKQ